jgi:hypothetical protein
LLLCFDYGFASVDGSTAGTSDPVPPSSLVTGLMMRSEDVPDVTEFAEGSSADVTVPLSVPTEDPVSVCISPGVTVVPVSVVCILCDFCRISIRDHKKWWSNIGVPEEIYKEIWLMPGVVIVIFGTRYGFS